MGGGLNNRKTLLINNDYFLFNIYPSIQFYSWDSKAGREEGPFHSIINILHSSLLLNNGKRGAGVRGANDVIYCGKYITIRSHSAPLFVPFKGNLARAFRLKLFSNGFPHGP
jgi:hypothetical protein